MHDNPEGCKCGCVSAVREEGALELKARYARGYAHVAVTPILLPEIAHL